MSISPEQSRGMQRYLQKVRELLHDASGFIAEDLLEESRRLVEHGEAPLGITQLAWIIHDEQILVPESIIQRVREYADAVEDFPNDFHQYIL